MKVNDLIKKYDGKTVVDSVSFEIPKGKVTSLIGPNGAGKSTVMGIISIVALNPDYIFVMDRDSAIGTNGAQMAQEIMENELIMKTNAYQNGHLVILENPGIWYLAEGGITSLGIMLEDLENALS